MPYPASHREKTREKVIQSARRLFNRHGFARVSIDDVMSDVGLTRGSFYSYFKTKSDLYAQAVASVVGEKRDILTGRNQAPVAPARIVRDYLSAEHFEDIDGSCPMIGLPSDISQTDESVKQAFESALRMLVEMFERDMKPNGRSGRSRALAVAALCVGGMVLARSVEDRALADEMRAAAEAAALDLGAWT
jgi:TetR/AcrR family transcriptional regulator, transcriptional repressor for nem operon